MSYTLVIVESPAKCDKIEKYLGPGYKCIASFGHLQQLISLKDIDISNNFKPTFTPIESKLNQIERIKKMISNANEVVLATDDDREGEGIAWHICKLFNLSLETTKRIIFHEVTEKGLKNAIKNPTTLNLDLVNAQQARQILDLLVGYIISPILWENISRTKKGLSAGRCQTPALRLIYENQKEIDNSPGKKVYNTIGYFTDKNFPFVLNETYNDEDKMVKFLEETVDFEHELKLDPLKNSTRKAPTPFTTSSLQQTASNDLHISPKDTMQICQRLYEAGYITYMRTDSKVYSKDFVEKSLKYIDEKYGERYRIENINSIIILDEEDKKLIEEKEEKEEKQEKEKKDKKEKKEKKVKKAKKENMAQEAHEAIRPTNINVDKLPEDSDFTGKEIRMYKLIWKNTLESCMADAIYSLLTAKIKAPFKLEYKFTGEEIVFEGWKIVEKERNVSIIDEKANTAYNYLPNLKEKIVNYSKITSKLTMKDLKTHYTEAKLVQLLEQKGIGRPSTFSSLIDKIQERGYVKKENIKGKTLVCTDFELEDNEITEIENKREFGNENNKLVIQSVGILVLEFLIKTYEKVFEYDYTKNMENDLDLIAKGEKEYYDLCLECYNDIKKDERNKRDVKNDIRIDEEHVYIIGKNGPVIKTSDNRFLSVRKDIDLDKLKNGDYKLEDIVEDNMLNRLLGKYENEDMYLKKGKFGMYVVWGENKKSLNGINLNETSIELNDVLEYLKNQSTTNSSIIRALRKDLSIRSGKYGDYIFYKTEKMSKPKFYKLIGFDEDYKKCELDIILHWIKEKYKV